VLLAIFLALSLALSGSLSNKSVLPPTQPGLGHDEGVFMRTTAEDGSPALYFIAHGARHSVLEGDMRTELSLNPLWPVRSVEREVALVYPEAAPIGAARVGLLQIPPITEEEVAHAADPETEPTTSTYTLQPGDNLTHVSRAYGTTVDAILHANGLTNANRIFAGRTIVIPGSMPAEIPASAVIEDAPLAAAPEDEASAESESSEPMTYTLKRGDNVTHISRAFGTTVEAILEANGIGNANRIYAGQTLLIPGA
jgi:LysM repeat protein